MDVWEATPKELQIKGPEVGASHDDWSHFVSELLTRGAAPNLCDVDGRTPLDLAVASGNVGAIRLLLEAGAGTKTKNRWGHTPADVARVVGASSEVRGALGLGPAEHRAHARRRAEKGNSSSEDGPAGLLGFLASISAEGSVE